MEIHPDRAWTKDERAAFFQAVIVAFLARYPIIHQDAAPALAALLAAVATLPLKSAAVQLRMAGDPLSAAEKRDRGFPVRLRIGDAFADILTDAGAADPALAAEAVAAAVFRAESRLRMDWLIRYERCTARLIIYDDEGTCAAARPLFKQHASWRALPQFPLSQCDKLLCRCSFDRAMPPRPTARIRHRKPKGCATAILLMVLAATAVVSACAVVL